LQLVLQRSGQIQKTASLKSPASVDLDLRVAASQNQTVQKVLVVPEVARASLGEDSEQLLLVDRN
jgi:hypothetical protein